MTSTTFPPTLLTNYESACNLITLLHILRHRPRPVRKGSNNLGAFGSSAISGSNGGSGTASSITAAGAGIFQFGNVQLRKDALFEPLNFPNPNAPNVSNSGRQVQQQQTRPKALCLRIVTDNGDRAALALTSSGVGGPTSSSYGNSFPNSSFAGGGSRRHTSSPGVAGSGVVNASFCSSSGLDLGGGAYGSYADPHQQTPLAAAGYGFTSIETAGNYNSYNNMNNNTFASSSDDLRTLETWTVEPFANTTIANRQHVPAVATKAQLAGFARALCSHSALNPLPEDVYRFAALQCIAEPSTSTGSAENNAGSHSTPKTAGRTDPTGGGGLPDGWTEQVWRLTTADRTPCLTITWRYNSSAVAAAMGGGGSGAGSIHHSMARRMSMSMPSASAQLGNPNTLPVARSPSYSPQPQPSPTLASVDNLHTNTASSHPPVGSFGSQRQLTAPLVNFTSNGSFDRAPSALGGAAAGSASSGGMAGGGGASSGVGVRGSASFHSPPLAPAVASFGSHRAEMLPPASSSSVLGGGAAPTAAAAASASNIFSTDSSRATGQQYHQAAASRTISDTPHYQQPASTTTTVAAAHSLNSYLGDQTMLFALIEGCERLTSCSQPQTPPMAFSAAMQMADEEGSRRSRRRNALERIGSDHALLSRKGNVLRDAVAEHKEAVRKIRLMTERARSAHSNLKRKGAGGGTHERNGGEGTY